MAASSKVPFRVVRVMPESHQALLFDRDHQRHVLAEVGEVVGAYHVAEIADDSVTLSREGEQVILVAPEHRRRGDREDAAPPATVTVVAKDTPPVVAPPVVAEPQDARGPVDPYAEPVDAPVRVVTAPDVTVRVAEAPPAPAAATAPAAAPAPTPVTAAAPAAVPVPAAATTPALASVTVAAPTAASDGASLKRAELTAALSDFTKLSAGFRADFTADGLHINAFAPGSLFARIGLQAGDTVTAVDGTPLHSLDDAAELYARVATAHAVAIAVTRAGKPMSLHVTID